MISRRRLLLATTGLILPGRLCAQVGQVAIVNRPTPGGTASIAVATPGAGTTSASTSLSGTYGGSFTGTQIDYYWSTSSGSPAGGSWVTNIAASPSGGAWSATGSYPAGAATYYLFVRETSATSVVSSASGSVVVSSGAGQTPMRAITATRRFGVHTHFEYTSAWSSAAGATKYNSTTSIQQALDGLNPAGRGTGIHILRGDGRYNSGGSVAGTHLATILALGGYQCMLYLGYPGGPNYDFVVSYMAGIPAGQTFGYEGALEVDNASWGMVPLNLGVILDSNSTTYYGWNGVASYQINMSQNATIAASGKPRLRWSLSVPANGAVGNAGATALTARGQSEATTMNYGNTHFYQKSGANPFSPANGQCLSNMATSSADTDAIGLPRAITEWGFLDLGTSDGYSMHGTETSVAFNYVSSIFNSIYCDSSLSSYAINVAEFYELFNTGTFGGSGVNGGTEEDCFGIYRLDGSPKQCAIALHDIFAVIGDAASNAATFTTSNLAITATGLPSGTYPAGGHYVLLQNAAGQFFILVWQNYNVYLNSGIVSPPSAVSVTMTFGRSFSLIERIDPLARASALAGTPGSPGTTLANMSTIGNPPAAQTISGNNAITWSFQGPMILRLTP
jgi:hypothetical protein